jgi:hypothetical protein
MKQSKPLTRDMKIRLSRLHINPNNWRLLTHDTHKFIVVHRYATQKMEVNYA